MFLGLSSCDISSQDTQKGGDIKLSISFKVLRTKKSLDSIKFLIQYFKSFAIALKSLIKENNISIHKS
jgi:hypothetical protein